MSTPSPQSGQDVETAAQVAQASVAEVRRFNNRICVVIADEATSEEVVRRWLGDTLPLRVTSWGHRAYQEVIRRLRPRVVVVLATNRDLAWDNGTLVACLFARFEPTVVSATLARESASDLGSPPHLLVHHLGFRAQTELASLAELVLLE